MGLFGKLFGGGRAPAPETRVRELQAHLDDPDPRIRERACRELGDLGAAARPAADRLLALTNDEDGDVCLAAADAYSKVERGFR
jgi:HEAT repeat protein